IEYTAKLDDYDVKSLAYTKSIKDNRAAPFEYVLDWVPDSLIPIDTKKDIKPLQFIYLAPLNFKRTYYVGEKIKINQVAKPIFARKVMGAGVGQYGEPEEATAILRVLDKDGNIVITEKNISLNVHTIVINEPGEYSFEYCFKRYPRYDNGNLINDHVDDKYRLFIDEYYENLEESKRIPKLHIAYRFKVKIAEETNLSVYDLIMRVSDMVSKFGNIESKKYFDTTRLFEITDPDEIEFLKSVEAPQTYIQNATLRQVLNLIFSYVNSISRLKHNDLGADILTFDEFDRKTGTFELVEIANKNTKRSRSELTIKATSFLERVMPTSLEEPTTISPGKDFYKSVRAIDINMTDDKFELKLDSKMYKPTKFTTIIRNVKVKYKSGASYYDYLDLGDIEIDLSKRLLTKEEWSLKESGTNFPLTSMAKPFSINIGMSKLKTENLYWQLGDDFIRLSDVYGHVFKSTLITNVIYSAVAEYFALNMIEPREFVQEIDGVPTNLINIDYEVVYDDVSFYKYDGVTPPMSFNLEYISLEDLVVDSERKDTNDNFDYYSASKLNQKEKLINVMSQTRGASADLQRTGQRETIISRFHENTDTLLLTGMYNKDHRLTITNRTLILHNEFIEAVYGLSKDFNRKAMFRGLQQEYRWSEIPTSNQVFQKNELYKDYLLITKPDEKPKGQLTKIKPEGHKYILETLINKNYEIGKKITLGYVRTDTMLEDLPEETYGSYHYILRPITSFGIDGGLTFSFSFKNNMVAGDAVEHKTNASVFNKAVKYTNDEGVLNKLWFGLKNYNDDGAKHSNMELNNYPLRKDYALHNTLIATGEPNFDHSKADYLVLYKDSSQVLKLTYQISIIPENPQDYVLGMSFFSNNLLTKEHKDKDMYLYLYDDEQYEYSIFDTLKVKDGWDERTILNENNIYIDYDVDNKAYEFLIDVDTGIVGSTLWAIGDEFGNLYIACNSNELGFRSTEYHFRPNVIEIGKDSQ
ncbi:MAG: hypothetical protein WCS56_03900, partial [Bacilli bacterium]